MTERIIPAQLSRPLMLSTASVHRMLACLRYQGIRPCSVLSRLQEQLLLPCVLCSLMQHALAGGCFDSKSSHSPVASAGTPHKGLHSMEALRLSAYEGHEQAQRS